MSHGAVSGTFRSGGEAVLEGGGARPHGAHVSDGPFRNDSEAVLEGVVV